MSTPNPILITGATGKQGGAVLDQLATHPSSHLFTLLAVTRSATSAAAQRLQTRYPGLLLVQGDLDDACALFAAAQAALRTHGAAERIWGVYSVQVSMGRGVTIESEVRQGKDLIDAAIAHGVAHFVYSSVDRGGNDKSLGDATPIPHFQSKFHIERHLLDRAGAKGETMAWTILRPVAFMDNLAPGMQTKVFLAALRDSLQGKALQWVSVQDIGLFAARAFCESEKWTARAEGLAGDELTFPQLSACFQRVTGAPAPVTFGILGSALKWAMGEMNTMLTWFRTDGYGVDVARLRKEEPELCGLERWLRERSEWRQTSGAAL